MTLKRLDVGNVVAVVLTLFALAICLALLGVAVSRTPAALERRNNFERQVEQDSHRARKECAETPGCDKPLQIPEAPAQVLPASKK